MLPTTQLLDSAAVTAASGTRRRASGMATGFFFFLCSRKPSLSNCLVCVWISVVQVSSLGLLLGRDFLDGIGTVLNFSRKLMRAEYLDGQSISALCRPLRTAIAPAYWPAPGPERWGRVGQDGVVEPQCSGKDWIQRKL